MSLNVVLEILVYISFILSPKNWGKNKADASVFLQIKT